MADFNNITCNLFESNEEEVSLIQSISDIVFTPINSRAGLPQYGTNEAQFGLVDVPIVHIVNSIKSSLFINDDRIKTIESKRVNDRVEFLINKDIRFTV